MCIYIYICLVSVSFWKAGAKGQLYRVAGSMPLANGTLGHELRLLRTNLWGKCRMATPTAFNNVSWQPYRTCTSKTRAPNFALTWSPGCS